ncbi:MAG TPA: 50S ribosomal protein L11 methyltransferase [Bryobacteraceae bacterium]|nr:50S ribosomal protein L11 methyltransferase [Bryobacteraceae bacterium]
MILGRRGIDTRVRLRRFGKWFKRKVLHQEWMADAFASPAKQGRLLSDKVRCTGFREAILRTVKPGDTVVDLGAGTGLLSFFALQAGARHVYAIELSRISEIARELIDANGFQKQITVIPNISTKVRLPERCDVLISETLSSFGFDSENIIESITDARKRFLKPEGRIIPESAQTLLVPFSSDDFGVGSIPQPFYGLNYQPYRKQLFDQPFLMRASGEAFVELSAPAVCHKLDFSRDSQIPGKSITPFRISRDGRLDGFLGWFEAQLAPGVAIGNSPYLPHNNWWQLYFPVLDQSDVRAGQLIILELEPKTIADEIKWSYTVRSLER